MIGHSVAMAPIILNLILIENQKTGEILNLKDEVICTDHTHFIK